MWCAMRTLALGVARRGEGRRGWSAWARARASAGGRAPADSDPPRGERGGARGRRRGQRGSAARPAPNKVPARGRCRRPRRGARAPHKSKGERAPGPGGPARAPCARAWMWRMLRNERWGVRWGPTERSGGHKNDLGKAFQGRQACFRGGYEIRGWRPI
ncbi:MAG: hypothetical protein J3K34DRAFT_408158 [Monoraphidium minutum]|nr:MAG: hypothetical protein J3K34DRAFT_408158 [Monoraphidium minutum]